MPGNSKFLLLLGLLLLAPLFWVMHLYLVAPLVIRRRNRTRVTRARPITPGTATDEVRELVREVARMVKPLGFDLLEVDELNDGMAITVHVYNAETHDHLLVYRMAQYGWEVFRTEFEDGQEVVTANPPIESVFSRPPTLHACALPPGTDLQTLYQAHRAHVRLKVPNARPVPGLKQGYVVHHEERGLETQCRLGVYRRVGDEYRPTLRGAFLTTWRLLPPLKGRRAAANRKIVRELMASA